MRALAKPLALVALGLTIAPPTLFMIGGVWSPLGLVVSEASVKTLMLIGTVLWFAAAPKWLKES